MTRNVAPSPGRLSMVSRPRWRLTMCLTMARPSPVPPLSRLSAGVDAVEALGQARQVLGRDARAVVAHARDWPRRPAPSPVRATDTSTWPPRWPYLIAFSIRFSRHPQELVAVARPRSRGSGGRVRAPARRPAPAASGRKVSDHLPRDAGEIDRRRRAAVLAHLDARQRQQVVDQPRHALRLLAHDAEEARRAPPASFRAGPCSVSMKPSSEASGVRSSWLALATKSTRISSSRRASVTIPEHEHGGGRLRCGGAPSDVRRAVTREL